MDIYVLDFETFYSDDYTLKKMTTEAYIRDPRFEALLLGVRFPDGRQHWFSQEDIPAFLASVDWTKAGIVAHHAQFDLFILAHHYGVRPAFILDTLGMARQVHGNHLSVALGSLAKHYGLADKSVPYNAFRGKRWADIPPALRQELGSGCLHDVALTWEISQKLLPGFPAEELRIIDMTVRMFTEPVLEGDTALLGSIWRTEETRKADLLERLAVTTEQLQSPEGFADLLRAEGLEPATKAGKNDTQIYAFAKTDDFMRELLEDDDDRLAGLAQARLGIRSTIDQTRAERLGFMSTRGAMPVYLRYCGAHTTRWSGGDGVNWQNFRRGSDIRRAVKAPAGCALVVLDLSQIEARILAVVAGQWDLVEKFRQGDDPYIGIASEFYGYEVTKGQPKERGTGKQLVLSCGYGSGAATIRATAKKGQYGPPVILSDDEAETAKELYRRRNPAIVRYWADARNMLNLISGNFTRGWGPLEIRDKRVYLPNGGWINYETMEWDPAWANFKYRNRQGWAKIWGSKLVAETTQALARVVASQAMLAMLKVGIRIAWCTHDDIVAVAPVNQAQAVYDFMLQEMKRAPTWLPHLPLDAEGFIGERYSK